MTATCTNADCPEQGIGKAIYITLGPDEQVMCGACSQPCELTEGTPAE